MLVSYPEAEPPRAARDDRRDDADRGDPDRGPADRGRARRCPSRCPTSRRRRTTPSSPSARSTSSVDEVEHRRPDQDPRDDLADDRRYADALGDLGRQLRRDEHDEDVAEDLGDFHGGGVSPAGSREREPDARGAGRRRCRPTRACARCGIGSTCRGLHRRAAASDVATDPCTDRRRRRWVELGVGEDAHLGHVHALELHLRVGRMPPFMTAFWILKKAKAIPKITVQITSTPMACELSWPRPRLKYAEDADDALAALGHVTLVGAFQPAP